MIQALFGWDGDHLYEFTVGKQRYSGAFGHLEETGHDHEVRITAALSAAKTITYVYDLGAYWEHEITLDKKLPLDPKRTYPVCIAFAGDSPVEYPDVDYGDGPEEPEPFDLDKVNRRLAGLLAGKTGQQPTKGCTVAQCSPAELGMRRERAIWRHRKPAGHRG